MNGAEYFLIYQTVAHNPAGRVGTDAEFTDLLCGILKLSHKSIKGFRVRAFRLYNSAVLEGQRQRFLHHLKICDHTIYD